jgi:hypothetical protein
MLLSGFRFFPKMGPFRVPFRRWGMLFYSENSCPSKGIRGKVPDAHKCPQEPRRRPSPDPDSVERRPVAALAPNARNARTHSEAQIGQIAASIHQWGWTVPVLVDEARLIIAGHGRVLAAQRLGLVEVPVMTARGWTDEQKRAYLIADNKLTENGGWDQALLRVELADLAAMGFDALLTGFSATEIKAMGNPGKTDPDEVPEPPDPESVISKAGDVWICGDHRIVCGDATDPAAVKLALDGAPAVDGDRSALWRELRSELANQRASRELGRDHDDRQGRRRRSRRLDRSLGVLPRSDRLRLARRSACRRGAEQPRGGRLHDARADHLGETRAHHQPGRLSLAARAVLVRGAQRQAWALGR